MLIIGERLIYLTLLILILRSVRHLLGGDWMSNTLYTVTSILSGPNLKSLTVSTGTLIPRADGLDEGEDGVEQTEVDLCCTVQENVLHVSDHLQISQR